MLIPKEEKNIYTNKYLCRDAYSNFICDLQQLDRVKILITKRMSKIVISIPQDAAL